MIHGIRVRRTGLYRLEKRFHVESRDNRGHLQYVADTLLRKVYLWVIRSNIQL